MGKWRFEIKGNPANLFSFESSTFQWKPTVLNNFIYMVDFGLFDLCVLFVTFLGCCFSWEDIIVSFQHLANMLPLSLKFEHWPIPKCRLGPWKLAVSEIFSKLVLLFSRFRVRKVSKPSPLNPLHCTQFEGQKFFYTPSPPNPLNLSYF